ncbi:lipid A Kdo2 1-phosphate O-methyltransferase [Paludibacter sp.]
MALQESLEKNGNFLFRYRSFLPLIIILVGICVFISDNIEIIAYDDKAYTIIEIIGLIVSFIGVAIRIIAVGHTPANTSGRNTKQQLADEINTTGIYSTVRHPLYLGNFFMWAGSVILIANTWFFIVFILAYWMYYERIMYAEEQFLRRKFGQPYINWAAQTPAFFPSFKNKTKSKYPFSIKKVLKKEKNGIFAIFVLLFIFHNIRYSISEGKFSIEINWVLWCTVISAALYLILKLLKKYTKTLHESGR